MFKPSYLQRVRDPKRPLDRCVEITKFISFGLDHMVTEFIMQQNIKKSLIFNDFFNDKDNISKYIIGNYKYSMLYSTETIISFPLVCVN